MSANRSNLLSAMTASHRSPPQINLRNEDRWPWSAAGRAGSGAKPAHGAVGSPRPHTPPGAGIWGVTGMEACLLSLPSCTSSTPPGVATSLLDKTGECEERASPQACGLSRNPRQPSPGGQQAGPFFG